MLPTHLSRPPTQSLDVGSDIMAMDQGPDKTAALSKKMNPALAEAALLIASYGSFGIIWLDIDLRVTDRFGSLVDFANVGEPITDSVLALIGLEDEMRALANETGRILELPAVGVAKPDGDSKRLNFSILWQKGVKSILILVYRSASQTELEIELSRQIRARLMAEAETTAKSKELARANADLESFAEIISHDLKGPMRHMRRLAQDLAADPGTEDDAGLRQRLNEIEIQSQRMSQMLSALLDYSSLGRKYEAVEDADSKAMVDSIARSLPTSGIEVRITGDWPRLRTLATLLDLVIRNLIDNALKHHDQLQGTITVHSTDHPHNLILTVSDDGPGIDPKHHASVFLPFRTLRPTSVHQGAGMGLAMVKKIVEAAGGSITLSSDPALGRGAVFTVFWPKHIVT